MVYVPRVFGFRIHRESKREQVSTSRQEAAAILDASGGRGAGTEEVVVPSSVALVGGPAPASAGADVADITTGVAKLGVGPEDAGSPEEEAD